MNSVTIPQFYTKNCVFTQCESIQFHRNIRNRPYLFWFSSNIYQFCMNLNMNGSNRITIVSVLFSFFWDAILVHTSHWPYALTMWNFNAKNMLPQSHVCFEFCGQRNKNTGLFLNWGEWEKNRRVKQQKREWSRSKYAHAYAPIHAYAYIDTVEINKSMRQTKKNSI